MMRRLARGAHDFIVPFVADEDDRVTFLRVANRFFVHFGDERAGGVDGAQIPSNGSSANFRCHAVSAIQYRRAFRYLVDAINKDDAFFLKALNDWPIVNDLVISVDRRVEKLDGSIQTFNGHYHAGTEAAGTGENNFHRVSPFTLAVILTSGFFEANREWRTEATQPRRLRSRRGWLWKIKIRTCTCRRACSLMDSTGGPARTSSTRPWCKDRNKSCSRRRDRNRFATSGSDRNLHSSSRRRT